MKWLGNVFCGLLFLLNLLAGIGYLVSAYSSYVSPENHPWMAAFGLVFPFFLLLNLVFLFVWLFVRKRFVLFPLLILAGGWKALFLYCPMNRAESPSGETLKLLTYNVAMLNFGDKDGEGARSNASAILSYLKESNADIVCLQEFVPTRLLSEKKLKEALPEYKYRKFTTFQSGNGVACLSRFPILSAKTISYNSLSNGSVLYKIKYGGDTLTVINNHLESNKLDSSDKALYNNILKSPSGEKMKTGGRYLIHKYTSAASLRAAQAETVSRVIRRNETPYMLVCGDLNDSPLSYTHRVIGENLQDAYEKAGFGPGISYHQNRFYFRIDHIFAGSAFRVLQCKTDRRLYASDHYPVWCILEKR